ncbi:hypothetical protein GGS20DRAFT_582045 [Poronia punctata]|nr:hypothetical protein GGS20DRAFT_582045 [Poronia punctata]
MATTLLLKGHSAIQTEKKRIYEINPIMADFANTLVVAIVATILSVLAFLALILVLALYWTNIVRRIFPNRFNKEPDCEKAWPSSSSESGSEVVSPSSSPRSSVIPAAAPPIPKAVLKG